MIYCILILNVTLGYSKSYLPSIQEYEYYHKFLKKVFNSKPKIWTK